VCATLLGEAGVADGLGAGATLELALLDHGSRDGRSDWRREYLDHRRRWRGGLLQLRFWIGVIILNIRVVVLNKVSGGKKIFRPTGKKILPAPIFQGRIRLYINFRCGFSGFW